MKNGISDYMDGLIKRELSIHGIKKRNPRYKMIYRVTAKKALYLDEFKIKEYILNMAKLPIRFLELDYMDYLIIELEAKYYEVLEVLGETE